MNREEFEGKWERLDEKVEAKWEKLTRSERSVIADRWQKRSAKQNELYDLSEEEAKRAIAVLPQTHPRL